MRFQEQSIDGIKIFHSTVSPGKRIYQPHHHADCELSMLISGNGLYSILDKNYSFQKNDIFLFGSNEIHCITDIYSDEPFDLLNIQFEPRLLWDNGNDVLPLLMLFNNRSESFSNQISRNNPSTRMIQKNIILIENEFKTQNIGYEMNVKLLLFSILLLLLRDYGYVKPQNLITTDLTVNSQLSKAMDYINSHLCDELSLAEIANYANLSKTYFSALFAKYNGLSLWEYITIHRVEKAVELLKNTDLSKTDIALQSGFSSSSNFYKAFKKITGKKPGDFQNIK